MVIPHKIRTGTSRSRISERVNRISPSGIRKFFDLLSSLEGVISLGVGEPDFVTPWHIREAAIYSLEKGHTMYTSNRGLLELRQELSRYLYELYGLTYNTDSELMVTTGVSEALDLAFRAIIDPGDEVLVADPCYVAYIPCITLAGGVPVSVPTSSEDKFCLRASAIKARITERTKALVLGYPANPTGAVMPREELVHIAEIAAAHDLLVVSDEIYDRLVYGVNHTCVAALPGMKERTVLLNGFSKAYAMTGWRVGYAAAPQPILEAMTKVHQYTMLCTPVMGQMAALEALRAGATDIADMLSDYNQRRQLMVKGLNDIGLTCFEPRGAFYAFPSIKSTAMSSEQFAERLLVDEKVAVVPGSVFGENGEGYVRCCYATSTQEIEIALDRMARFVSLHRK